MEIFVMKQGERREIAFTLTAQGENVTITTPTYELCQNGEIINQGTATVSDTEFLIYVEPPTAGTYYLNITFTAGYQRLIKQLEIRVQTPKF